MGHALKASEALLLHQGVTERTSDSSNADKTTTWRDIRVDLPPVETEVLICVGGEYYLGYLNLNGRHWSEPEWLNHVKYDGHWTHLPPKPSLAK